MPEGPELHLTTRFVNRVCAGRTFSGKIVKSEVHKSGEVPFDVDAYTIYAESRGKEMRLCLAEVSHDIKKTGMKSSKLKDVKEMKYQRILFRFGMSGKFEFTPLQDIHKHSHLRFFTKDKPLMMLSYVDVRRFGRWELTDNWSKDRGPDPMFEYGSFRSNVIKNLENAAFDRPICETMLNQKYFNGIGNYLRAEILFRLKIPPFEQARKVLDGLPEEPPDIKPNIKGQKTKQSAQPDLLHLCHSVPLEVVNLGGGGYDPEGNKTDYTTFNMWLQCYYQEGMKNMVDHNARTIWFQGPAGPMVPKENKSRKTKSKKGSKNSSTEEETEEAAPSPPKKKKSSSSKISKKGSEATAEESKQGSETKSRGRKKTVARGRGITKAAPLENGEAKSKGGRGRSAKQQENCTTYSKRGRKRVNKEMPPNGSKVTRGRGKNLKEAGQPALEETEVSKVERVKGVKGDGQGPSLQEESTVRRRSARQSYKRT